MQKPYKIFTRRIAHALCKRGFQIIGTEINYLKPWLYVYLFENTEELRLALEEEKRGAAND